MRFQELEKLEKELFQIPKPIDLDRIWRYNSFFMSWYVRRGHK